MRSIPGTCALVLLLAGVACEQSTTRGPAGNLTLTKPADQTLKRGETNTVAIAINRDGFSGPVTVKFQRLPKGVHVVETKPIAADQSKADYTLHADNDADLVEKFEASVLVEGPDRMGTAQTFLISVRDKDK